MNPWLSSPLHFSPGFAFLCSQNSCSFDQTMVSRFARIVSRHVGSLAMSHAGFVIVIEMLQDESISSAPVLLWSFRTAPRL